MVRLFPKKTRPVGLPPGSLLYTALEGKEKEKITLIEYTEGSFSEKENASIEECLDRIGIPSIAWIQVNGPPSPETISSLGEKLHLHSLFLEDVMSTGQRSKLDTFQDQIFIIVRLLQYDEVKKNLRDEQASIIFGPNYLISFIEGREEIFNPIKERLRQGNSRMHKQSSDYLAYTLLDTIVDYYFIVLEKVDLQLDSLEEEVVNFPKPTTLHKIQQTKREMIILRKAIWPMRDVINRFIKLESPLVNSTTQLYLQDIHDHTIQTIDIIESFRDVVSGMLDIYLSNINIRTNDIMKVLTIVSTIFVPLTFISSLYGMNFEHMPELHTSWGYPAAISLMVATAAAMLLFFRRKKWI